MDYKDALKYIKTGESVLFVGSFFSRSAKNTDGKNLPLPSELKQIFIDSLHESSDDFKDDSLDSTANYAQKHLTPTVYQRLLKSTFKIKKIDKKSQIISSQPWLAIFTTNYDNLIEIESLPSRKTVSPYSEVDKLESIKNEVIHVNGAIDDLKGEPDDIHKLKLSSSDYLENSFEPSPLKQLLLSSLKSAKAIFYVGYSGKSDFDISTATYNDSSLRKKSFFIDGHNIHSKAELERLSLLGNDTNESSEDFANDISQLKEAQVNNEPSHYHLLSFKEISQKINDHPNTVSLDSNLRDLVRKGFINNDLLQNDGYIVDRWTNISNFLLNSNDIDFFTVSSRLGNGKTVFMRALSQYISNQRHTFFYSGNPDFLFNDLSYIQEHYSDSIIFIDNMSDLRNSFTQIVAFSQKNMQFVISDRTPLLSQITATLITDFNVSEEKFSTISNLDELTYEDFKKWEKNLNDFHLIKKDIHNKKNNVRNTYKKQKTFSNILLTNFHNSGIIHEYKKIIKTSSNDHMGRRLIVLILMLNIINSNSDEYNLDFLMTILKMNTTHRMENSKVYTEFIDFKKRKIINSSSILAKALLQGNEKEISYSERTDILIDIINNLETFPKSKQIDSFRRLLTSFSNISLTFSHYKHDKNTAPHIEKFYTEVQSLDSLKNNIFFMIQLASSKIYSGKFELASDYLDIADQLADEKHLKHRYQLINTRINLYIESASTTLTTEPQKFIDHLSWISYQQFGDADYSYLATMFGKLNRQRKLINKSITDKRLRGEIYNILVMLYAKITKYYAESEVKAPKNLQESIKKFNLLIESIDK